VRRGYMGTTHRGSRIYRCATCMMAFGPIPPDSRSSMVSARRRSVTKSPAPSPFRSGTPRVVYATPAKPIPGRRRDRAEKYSTQLSCLVPMEENKPGRKEAGKHDLNDAPLAQANTISDDVENPFQWKPHDGNQRKRRPQHNPAAKQKKWGKLLPPLNGPAWTRRARCLGYFFSTTGTAVFPCTALGRPGDTHTDAHTHTRTHIHTHTRHDSQSIYVGALSVRRRRRGGGRLRSICGTPRG